METNSYIPTNISNIVLFERIKTGNAIIDTIMLTFLLSSVNYIIKWINNNINIYNNNTGNIGIGISNPLYKLDINGNVRITSNLIIEKTINTTDIKLNNYSLYSYENINSLTYTNAIETQMSEFDYYLTFTNNSTITFLADFNGDLLIVGAGGNGGIINLGGGGGAGEIIYYPNYQLTPGVYGVNIGKISSYQNFKITKLI